MTLCSNCLHDPCICRHGSITRTDVDGPASASMPDWVCDWFCKKCRKLLNNLPLEMPKVAKKIAALEAALAEKKHTVSELDEMLCQARQELAEKEAELRTNAQMLAKLHDTTVPEKRHKEMLAEKNARIAELEAALSAADTLMATVNAHVPDTGDDWWCPVCEERLDRHRVTNGSCCDACGTYLPPAQPDEWSSLIRDRAEEYKAARKALDKQPPRATEETL